MHWMGSFTGTTAAWAAAFISFISVVINLWIPSRHRPQASFTLIEHPIPGPSTYKISVDGHGDSEIYYISLWTHRAFHLRNLGDGAGYNVSISFVDCHGRTAIRTGPDSLDLATNGVFSTNDSIWVYVEKDSLRESSALEVHWVTPPTRLNHCRYQRISIPAPPHKWGIGSRVSETGRQWLLHRSWHHRDRTGQLYYQ